MSGRQRVVITILVGIAVLLLSYLLGGLGTGEPQGAGASRLPAPHQVMQ